MELSQSYPPHILWFHRKNAIVGVLELKAHSPCPDKGLLPPGMLVPKCILSVIGFGHVSANCYVIIRRVLQHHVGTTPFTLVVVSWVSGFVLVFSSTQSVS